MKKKLAVLMVAVMLVLGLSGCGSNDSDGGNAGPEETYTIAVAWHSIDASTQTRMDYLEKYLGPEIGVDFIFSETISDTDSLITFMENSYAAGADALLSTVTDGVEQIAPKAEELGMYTAFVSSTFVEEVENIPTYMGITGIDLTKVADAYSELIDLQFDPAEPTNFIIISGGSAMGVASHREATISMLRTLENKYGLTYDMDAAELAKLNATTDIATGNADVKITIVPGFPNMEGYISGVSGLLQTGEYDAVVSVYPTAEVFATAIDEVEKALGKNIKVLCQANFGDNTKYAFETMDSTGNPTLDGAILNSGTASDAFAVILLYNGITGNSDVVKPDGKAIIFPPGPLVCGSAAVYENLELLDTSDDTYVFSADEVKQALKAYNSEATYEDIMKMSTDFSTEDILQRRGIGN